jgi:antibiotic biosynthesis monooxygenase (ABM) superfamily enzyme
MAEPVHFAVTRRVCEECVEDFERALSEFARRSPSRARSAGSTLSLPASRLRSMEYVAMPLLLKIAHGWLYPKNKVSQYS